VGQRRDEIKPADLPLDSNARADVYQIPAWDIFSPNNLVTPILISGDGVSALSGRNATVSDAGGVGFFSTAALVPGSPGFQIHVLSRSRMFSDGFETGDVSAWSSNVSPSAPSCSGAISRPGQLCTMPDAAAGGRRVLIVGATTRAGRWRRAGGPPGWPGTGRR
jgi:hypothetical protein